MCSILEHRKDSPQLSSAVLSSSHHHLLYLTPQRITLGLADTGLEDSNSEIIAMAYKNRQTSLPCAPWRC